MSRNPHMLLTPAVALICFVVTLVLSPHTFAIAWAEGWLAAVLGTCVYLVLVWLGKPTEYSLSFHFSARDNDQRIRIAVLNRRRIIAVFDETLPVLGEWYSIRKTFKTRARPKNISYRVSSPGKED